VQAGGKTVSVESLEKVDERVVDEAPSPDADEIFERIKTLESAG
jgi:hypothetical protein